MTSMIENMGRQDDIVMVVVQNNQDKTTLIEEIKGTDNLIQDTLGKEKSELLNTSFKDILPERIQENLEDYIEYEEFGSDFGDVLKRTPKFAVQHSEGELIDIDLRVQNGVMGEHPRFILMMSDKKKSGYACIKALADNAANLSQDGFTNLLDRASFFSQTKIVEEFIEKDQIAASLAVIKIAGSGASLLSAFATEMNRNFRTTDEVAYLGDGVFAAILLKTGREGAHIALNRLRHNLDQTRTGEQLDAAIGYHVLEKFETAKEIVANSANILADKPMGETLIEIM